MSLILGAGLTLMAVTANGNGPGARFDRAALQAELTALFIDTCPQAAAVGRAVVARALAVAQQAHRSLVATRGVGAQRS